MTITAEQAAKLLDECDGDHCLTCDVARAFIASEAARKLAEERLTKAVEASIRTAASLAAAISLLERTPKAKKSAPSDKMFDQMLSDYRATLENARAILKEIGDD